MIIQSGKVVLVTGGAGDLGRNFTETFLQAGCKVLICDIKVEETRRYVEKLSLEYESNINYAICDITSDESFRDAFKKCLKLFGRIDIVINNAAIANEMDIKADINVNLLGTIRGTELALKFMGKDTGHEGGMVINIASIAGLKNLPFFPYYSTSKSGVIHYTRVIGHPFHYNYTGVVIQCLCTSMVETHFTQDSTATAYNTQCEEAMKCLIEKAPKLKVKEVADALFTLIEDGNPGSVMALEKGKEPYYVDPSVPS